MCVGVCGKEYSGKVFELNRLCLNKKLEKNALSFFVSSALKELKKHNLIIVSYSDTGMNHNGYIHQATNFLYTGITKQRTDKYTDNGKHSRHYNNKHNELRKIRTAKHRYIYFCCNKSNAKKYKKALNYPIKKYPKGKNKNYVLGEKMQEIIINKKTGEVYKR